MKGQSLILISIIALLLIGCATSLPTNNQPSAPYKLISGTVMYPNIVYFPSRLRLEINLMGRNQITGETSSLVSQTILNPLRFPLNFILRYDPNEIVRSVDYFLTVNLYREGESSPYLSSYEVSLPSLKGDDSVYIELQTIT
ncbi:MAG: YbaY family lipoprotein [Sphaerochaetaceae bacterium]|nr:YbaY family lipoprotein [Sphaerochaetaceae bacterium]